MPIYRHKNELNPVLQKKRNKNYTIGLIPTMGALHEGHLSLVKKAIEENDVVVVSIFVNPTQFDNKKDLEKYPSSLKDDMLLLESISNDIIIYAPSKTDIYSGEVRSKKFNFNGLEKVMEGSFRTGHFDGVATIVELLLLAVQPHRAYFGEKDFQQLQIIKKLVEQNNIPVQIVPCPILREINGLAMSSRNERLTKGVREKAGFIYHVLTTAKSDFGTKSATDIRNWVKEKFKTNDIFELEYFEIADVETLTPILKKQIDQKYRAFIAVYVSDVRLIDNIALN